MTTDNEKNRDREMSAMSPQERLEFLERLERAHEKFMRAGVRKTGYNKFQKYNYFTLDDIMPVADRVLKEEGLLITFGETDDNRRCAYVTDRRNPNNVMVFKGIPVSPEMPKTDDEVKMFGKVNTYSRRYLYMDILNICETDEVDESGAYTPVENPFPVDTITESQKEHLRELFKECQRSGLCATTRDEITRNGKNPIKIVDYNKWCKTMEFAINQRKQNI